MIKLEKPGVNPKLLPTLEKKSTFSVFVTRMEKTHYSQLQADRRDEGSATEEHSSLVRNVSDCHREGKESLSRSNSREAGHDEGKGEGNQ